MLKRAWRLILVAAAGLALFACSPKEEAAKRAEPAAAAESPARVFAAASLADVLKTIGDAYAAAGHPRPVLNLAASSELARQIEQGAEADIFISADVAWMDYLDERFPHPPLMPVDPVSRARARLALYQIEHDWYDLARKLDAQPQSKDAPQIRKVLRDNVLGSADLFKLKPYFLSDEFSMVDATIAPILWRLPRYEIDLPPQAQPILKYAGTIFSRPAFRASLSETEREMRLA